MIKNKIISRMFDLLGSDEIRNEFSDDFDIDDDSDDLDKQREEEVLTNHIYELYDEFKSRFSKGAEEVNGKLKIYRCIAVNNIPSFLENLDQGKAGDSSYEGYGLHWSWHKDTAVCHWENRGGHKDGKKIVLTALVDPKSINYVATTKANLHPQLGPNEQEIELNKGSNLTVISVEDFRGDEDLWRGKQMVKASMQPNHTLINSLQVLAGIQDTEYPYYHVSDYPETPSIRSEAGIHKDPAGIYLFYKGKPIYQTDWKPKKYRWDANLSAKITDINDLDYDHLLAKAGIEDIRSYVDSLKNTKTMDLESWKDIDYESWLESGEEFVWTDVGFPLLREHFNDQKKFANFLLDQGIKALGDTQGHTVFFGEPQVIVLDPSIIEWGTREENVADNKVYIMSALQASLKPRPNRTLIAALKALAYNEKHLELLEDWVGSHRNQEKVLQTEFPDEFREALEYGTDLYRGMTLSKTELDEFLEGKPITVKGSWSTQREIGEYFAEADTIQKDKGYGILLSYEPSQKEIVVNIPAVVKWVSENIDEDEIEEKYPSLTPYERGYSEGEVLLKPVEVSADFNLEKIWDIKEGEEIDWP